MDVEDDDESVVIITGGDHHCGSRGDLVRDHGLLAAHHPGGGRVVGEGGEVGQVADLAALLHLDFLRFKTNLF